MESFLTHVPAGYGESLRRAIEAVNESKALLAEVVERFGTADPQVLRGRMGESCNGICIDAQAIAALETLRAVHEQRRAACLAVMEQAANGHPAPPSPGDEP